MGLRDCKRGYRIPKALNVRPGGDRDTNLVKDLDLKCYHYPWETADWEVAFGESESKWCIATLRNKAVGFAIWRISNDLAFLDRIGVRPDSRKKGIGTEILRHVVRNAVTQNTAEISTTVPEINCFPGHPDDVSAWLLARSFRADTPVISNYAFMYGKWVDGFCFVRHLEEVGDEFVV